MKVSELLLLLSASFASYNIGMVGGFIIGLPDGRISFGGLIGGVVVNLAVAIAATKRGALNSGSRKRSKRERQIDIGMYSLMVISAALVATVTFLLMGDRVSNEYWRGILSAGYATLPELAIYTAGASNGARGVLNLETKITVPRFISLLWKNWLTRLDSDNVKVDNVKAKVDKKPIVKTTKKRKQKAQIVKMKKSEFTLDIYNATKKKNPDWTQAQIAKSFGVSRQTLSEWLKMQ